MKFEGFVGTDQRLRIVILPAQLAAKWSADALSDATAPNLVVMKADAPETGDQSVNIELQPGRYDVWGESYELRGAWGLAEIRIRLVPHGQGILVGARLGG